MASLSQAVRRVERGAYVPLGVLPAAGGQGGASQCEPGLLPGEEGPALGTLPGLEMPAGEDFQGAFGPAGTDQQQTVLDRQVVAIGDDVRAPLQIRQPLIGRNPAAPGELVPLVPQPGVAGRDSQGPLVTARRPHRITVHIERGEAYVAPDARVGRTQFVWPEPLPSV